MGVRKRRWIKGCRGMVAAGDELNEERGREEGLSQKIKSDTKVALSPALYAYLFISHA